MKKLLLVCLFSFRARFAGLGRSQDRRRRSQQGLRSVLQDQGSRRPASRKSRTATRRKSRTRSPITSTWARKSQTARQAANDPTLSAEARARQGQGPRPAQQDLVKPASARSRKSRPSARNEIKDELVRRHKEIVDEITKIITDYSGPQGYDLVIDKSSASVASGVSIVLYNSTKLTRYHRRHHHQAQRRAHLPAAPSAAVAPGAPATPLTNGGPRSAASRVL